MKRIVVILAVICLAFGCSKSNDPKTIDRDTFLEQLQSVPSVNIPIESFPEWLVAKVTEIEALHSKDVSMLKLRIFRGEWKGHTVYYVRDPFASCGFCEVYYEDGKNVIWSAEDVTSDSFCTESKDWVLIYEFGEGPAI
jgi:hypothetical protein